MADAGTQRELVFCHACQNEWYRNEGAFQCPAPNCHSECVEVIENGHDPRENVSEEESPELPLPPHQLHEHNPWDGEDEDFPDPEDGNIDHVEWDNNGVHYSRTSYRSTLNFPGGLAGGREGGDGREPHDLMGAFMASMLAARTMPGNGGPERRGPPSLQREPGRPGFHSVIFDGSRQDRMPPFFGPTNAQARNRRTTSIPGLRPRDANNAQPPTMPLDDLHGLLNTMMAGLGGATIVGGGGNATGAPSPLALLSQLFNPANAQHGDAVYTQEALDRIISQLMEQHSGSTAPGPAPADQIEALPKVQVDQSMLGSDGKAECSICMDNVPVGETVTRMNCSHWFHTSCVNAWLNEHNSCPICRKGLSEPKNDVPEQQPGQRSTSQSPWVNAPRFSSPRETPESSGSRPDTSRRSSSQSGGSGGSTGNTGNSSSGGSGISGWLRERLGGGGGNNNNNH